MDCENLIYNPDGEFGTDSWSGNSLDISNGIITVTGDLTQSTDYLVPVSSDDSYKISFDIKFNTRVSNNFYIALNPRDNDKNRIYINTTYKPYSNADTTLASALSNGATTVTLTDGSKWDSTHQYQRFAICNNLAWGYNRASNSYRYTARSGNVLTLESAWTGGTIAAGTKVTETRDGSTYYYPAYYTDITTNSNRASWVHVESTFKGGSSMRYSCQYFQFMTLGHSNNYSIKNLRIENVTTPQYCSYVDTLPKLLTNGNAHFCTSELGMNIRYIKDTVNGSSVNTACHWVEIQANNYLGENMAWNKYTWSSSTSSKFKSYITDGSTATSPYYGLGSGEQYVVVDLAYVTTITSIKVWHYWGDGRTYNDHKIEVSADGTNWITVYAGVHAETSEGFEVALHDKSLSIQENNFVLCNEIIEI